MQLKVWLVSKHLSHLGMQLNVLFTKNCVRSHKVIVSVALAVSLLLCQNGRKWWWEWVRKSWKSGAKTEAKTESQNAATTRRDRWVWKRGAVASEAKKHVAILRNDHILAFSEVFEISLISLNSFSVPFTVLTLFTPCCRLSQKPLPTVMCMSRFKGCWDWRARRTLRIHTPSTYVVAKCWVEEWDSNSEMQASKMSPSS